MSFQIVGLSDDQIAQLRIGYLTDTVEFDKELAGTADDTPTWTAVNPEALTPCKLFERNAFSFRAQGIDQEASHVLLAGGEDPLQSQVARYRARVSTYKPDPTAPGGDPIPDRTYTLLVLSAGALRDAAGAHVFQVIGCKLA